MSLEILKKIEKNPNIILDKLSYKDSKESFAYISGSLTEGFGNATSDIDVFIIYDNRDKFKIVQETSSVIKSENSIINNFIYQGIRFDIEYLSLNHFNRIISKLNNINFKTDEHIFFEEDILDFIHRLINAMPIANEEKFVKIKSNINFENLKIYQAINHSRAFADGIEDIRGATISKDFGTAFFRTRKMIDICLNGFLCIQGETNPKSKWIYRKLLRYISNNKNIDLLNTYIDLQTNHPFNDENTNDYIKKGLKFCHSLNSEIQKYIESKINE
ncbi:hypothetical protein AN1V17_39490 [Vallitalea sediminicola]